MWDKEISDFQWESEMWRIASGIWRRHWKRPDLKRKEGSLYEIHSSDRN